MLTVLLSTGAGLARAQLSLDVGATPDPVLPGELLRYELTVTNTSAGVVTAAVLHSQPSAMATIVAIDGGSRSPSNCIPGSTVMWDLGSLPAGQTVTRQLIVRAAANLTTGTLLSNTSRVTATNAPEVDVNRSLMVDAARALSVTIAEVSEPAVPGELLTYVVNFANTGVTAVAGVMLDAVVPDGRQFASATQAGTEQGGTVTWSLGTLGVGESGERRFTAASGTSIFSAAELSDALDPNEVRARAEAATPVRAAPPLTIDMTLTPDPVRPSELVRYELTVHNRSLITATGAMLQDFTLDSTSIVAIDGGACSPSNCIPGSSVTWPLGDLPAGQSVTRQLILRAGAVVATGTLLFNTARVTSTNSAEVHAERSVPVDSARGLTVAIAETTEPAVPGA